MDRARSPGSLVADNLARARWAQGVIIVLGVWLMTSAPAFGTGGAPLLNDLLCGVALILLAIGALFHRKPHYSYAEALVGVWLLMAPVALWAPSPITYAGPTLIGVLVIGVALVLPLCRPLPGPAVPPGWSYNPSSWSQRLPIIALGLIGFFASRHLAAYQLGYIDSVWDPLFGAGTERVLDSSVSRWFPVSDAALGAVVYLVDSLSAMGEERRWRTTPWMVAILGVAAIPLGLVSMILLILQPTVVGQWCFLCLIQATATLAIIALALDELAASAQFLARSRRAGRSLWRTFWLGGEHPAAAAEARPDRREAWTARSMTWGTTAPWNLVASALVGAWLMFSPELLGHRLLAAGSDHVVGALVLMFSVISFAEIARPLRLVNGALAAWLLLAAWILPGGTLSSGLSATASAALLLLLIRRRGPVREDYGQAGGLPYGKMPRS